MITTSSFPNTVTSSPSEDIKVNTLTKEDLEGEIKKNIKTPININGGDFQIIDL